MMADGWYYNYTVEISYGRFINWDDKLSKYTRNRLQKKVKIKN